MSARLDRSSARDSRNRGVGPASQWEMSAKPHTTMRLPGSGKSISSQGHAGPVVLISATTCEPSPRRTRPDAISLPSSGQPRGSSRLSSSVMTSLRRNASRRGAGRSWSLPSGSGKTPSMGARQRTETPFAAARKSTSGRLALAGDRDPFADDHRPLGKFADRVEVRQLREREAGGLEDVDRPTRRIKDDDLPLPERTRSPGKGVFGEEPDGPFQAGRDGGSCADHTMIDTRPARTTPCFTAGALNFSVNSAGRSGLSERGSLAPGHNVLVDREAPSRPAVDGFREADRVIERDVVATEVARRGCQRSDHQPAGVGSAASATA